MTSVNQWYCWCQTLKLFLSLLLSTVIQESDHSNPPPAHHLQFSSRPAPSGPSAVLIRSPAPHNIHSDLQPLFFTSSLPPPVSRLQWRDIPWQSDIPTSHGINTPLKKQRHDRVLSPKTPLISFSILPWTMSIHLFDPSLTSIQLSPSWFNYFYM